VTLTASSSDPQGGVLSYSWDLGDGTKASGASVTHSYPAEGAINLAVVANNSAGLTANGSSILNIVAVAPAQPGVLLSDAVPFPGETITLTASSTDPQNSALTYTWDFGSGQTATGAVQSRTYAIEGSFNASITVTNAFAKSTTRVIVVPVVAWKPPSTPAIVANPATPKPGETVTLTASASDPQGSTLSYAWDFGDGTRATGNSVTHSYPAEGAMPLSVQATNRAGISATARTTLDVVAIAPSQPTVVLSDTAPYPTRAVTFTATATDPQNSPLTYIWDFGDGGTALGAVQTHAFAAEGSFNVTSAVVDGFRKASSRIVIVPVVARPPVITVATANIGRPRPGEVVIFSVAATDIQGSLVTFSWAFQDGSTATGATPTHAFAAEGAYPVAVTATNAFGKSVTRTVSIAVTAQPPVFTSIGSYLSIVRPFAAMAFSATATDPQGSALSYAWDFGDGGHGSGAGTTHAYSVEGAFTPAVTVTNTYNKAATFTFPAPVTVRADPPTVPAIGFQPALPKPGDSITMVATSSDPQGTVISYQWSFGDGQTGAGSTTAHSYAAEGNYSIQVQATNAFQKSSSYTTVLGVIYRPPTAPVITPAGTTVQLGQGIAFSASSTDPGGFPITYAWDFGDGTGTSSGAALVHTYASLGKYTVTVTAANSRGKVSTASVAKVGVIQATGDDQFGVNCTGPDCGALDAHTYRGDGRGIWAYNNTTSAPVTLDISIQGVTGGKRAVLVFSNGGAIDTGLPGFGVLASPVAAPPSAIARPTAPAPMTRDFSAAHGVLLAQNRQLAQSLVQSRPARGLSALPSPAAAAAAAAPPAVGSTRVWYDNFASSPIAYTAAVASVCTSPRSGRNIVFWVDPNLTSMSAAQMQGYSDAFCGATGGYDRLTGLLGDAWGAAAAQYPGQLIQDAPALQDVNVVFLNVPTNTSWGGYFSGGNNYLSSNNQALAFFINGPGAAGWLDYYVDVLVHELTHMVNFYQRTVAHGVYHDTWLEESSAMMAEDIVGPYLSATGFNDIFGNRIPNYYNSRGGLSLINWSTLNPYSYAIGGSFGAFLSRRYGLPMFTGIGACGETALTLGTSYQCVDALVRALGGRSYGDDFARFGTSVFSVIGTLSAPPGYGYPTVSSQGYTLQALPIESMPVFPQFGSTVLGATFRATSHAVSVEFVAAGATAYARNSVTVPAYSSLTVVIQ
jgi:PKD repeat protein